MPIIKHTMYIILQYSELVCELSCAESQAFVMGQWFLKDIVICALLFVCDSAVTRQMGDYK